MLRLLIEDVTLTKGDALHVDIRFVGGATRSLDLPLPKSCVELPLRANIDETVLPVVITEQGENRNRCEEQRNLFGFSYGLACRGT